MGKRILLVNKFYYPRGGDCVYTLELERLLLEKNCEVAVFAMQHPLNNESKWRSYFPSEISFSPKQPRQFFKALFRPLFSWEVARKFKKLLKDFKPDVVHLNNIHTQISPIVAKIAHQHGIRVVWTLHDYKLLCPRYDCLRNGKPCELCLGSRKEFVLLHRCMKNSLFASLIAYVESIWWSGKKLQSYTDVFICPSSFLYERMRQAGFQKNKLLVLHNAVSLVPVSSETEEFNEFYCYMGRISQEKGLRTLLDAASKLPYPLKIIGTGPLLDELKKSYENQSQIQFLGHCSRDKVFAFLKAARFSVIPSEWYENNPLSVIESLMVGTPVLGANIGGIPELVDHHSGCGMLFEPGNAKDLEEKIVSMWNDSICKKPMDCRNITSMSTYVSKILEIYGSDNVDF